MRSAVVLLVVFAVCWAQEAPKPCCYPKQYEGNMNRFSVSSDRRDHLSGLMMVEGRISYDASAKKVAVTTVCNRGPPVKTIMDYSAGKMYMILGKNCTVYKKKGAFKPDCIPSIAKYTGPFFQGAGSDKLNEDAWTINGLGTRTVLSVTKSKCVPVGEFFFERNAKAEFVSTMGYSNVTLGIKDPNVFKPPASCKGVEEEDHFFGEEYQILEYLRMKHTA